MATHSTMEPGGLQPLGAQRVGHNLVTKQNKERCTIISFEKNMKSSLIKVNILNIEDLI